MSTIELETLAKNIADKTGAPIEVCRAGLLLVGASIGEAIGIDAGAPVASADRIIKNFKGGK